MDVVKVSEGSPLLAGQGLISLSSAAFELGLTDHELLMEMRNTGMELLFQADDWSGKAIPIDKVEREYSEDRTSYTYLIDHALEIGTSRVKSGLVLPSKARLAIDALGTSGVYTDWLFFEDRERTKAIFFPPPGVEVKLGDALVQKGAMEGIRVRLAAAVTPAMVAEAKSLRILAVPGVPMMPVKGHLKYEEQPVSALIAEFCETKGELGACTPTEDGPVFFAVYRGDGRPGVGNHRPRDDEGLPRRIEAATSSPRTCEK
jgi:hypothetical protein